MGQVSLSILIQDLLTLRTLKVSPASGVGPKMIFISIAWISWCGRWGALSSWIALPRKDFEVLIM